MQEQNGAFMNAHQKKMIAPIVITFLLSAYMLAYFIFLIVLPMPVVVKVLVGVIPLALLGASVYVLVQRIQEIRSGEEDDLSQY
jgi:hypothetical protein